MSVTGKVKKIDAVTSIRRTPKIVGGFCSKGQAGVAFVISVGVNGLIGSEFQQFVKK